MTIRPGDIVRVKDPDQFLAAFGKKIRDRDAEVLWVGPTSLGMHNGRACVLFKKRNGRGQEFQEIMRIDALSIQGNAATEQENNDNN